MKQTLFVDVDSTCLTSDTSSYDVDTTADYSSIVAACNVDSLNTTNAFAVPSHINSRRTQKRRKQTLTYRSTKLYEGLNHIALLLQGGSVRKVLIALWKYDSQTFSQTIARICHKEAALLSKDINSKPLRSPSTLDLLQTDVKEIDESLKQHSPVTWNALAGFATNRRGASKGSYIRTAALVLANSRSQFLNRFQVLNAIALYRFDISNEGIQYLHAIGVVCFDHTLYARLKDVKAHIE